MNYKKTAIYEFTIITFTLLIAVFLFDYHCLFKCIFNIPCPGCGLTRAFIEIINFRFLNSFSYNILGLPIFICLLSLFCVLVYDFKFKNDLLNKIMYIKLNMFQYLFLIILVLTSWYLNILRMI